ncbi:MAG: ribose 5-phosphate isomerase B [Candidatus Marinamargulisbacteria bacterium]
MILIAADHGGYELKEAIKEQLNHLTFKDVGTHSADRVDYPLFADKLCKGILSDEATKGILICGTGIGISIRANRYDGIRAALVYDSFTAEMAKAHNNANVLCLGGRTLSSEDATLIIQKWLDTDFESGRHVDRLALLDAPKTPIN